ncbi:recombinase family protein [Sphingorhabdus pulchriflava]|uniref:Recombinase family protein n=1 Tax=Sphingorhabdus pulchriflava TaxID=2292257 RepID=A0A371B4T7_9SPHN|nr:recombinase family protein [Sphingorhabdus pulchriflava]RDV02453.1 recombinase family protein [Sphingorhabdus pulchriflava]
MKQLRCAIYTRKSTEEGLEQEFNSIDAQRAACEAYILSQAGERWTLLPQYYDDGGWSGGNMERPALKSLLKAISEGRIDVVVVYKVDRLTRSLMDFARIVEKFDAHQVSFVSVTQAFNTTSSMGRLTLIVLLSFAQFEREVTGERIRDKIAASKARGIWMGGNLPLGYDVKDRKLFIVEDEAELVRYIYSRYLELGSVLPLAKELDARGHRTKRWTSAKGNVLGGYRFSCGAIYHILGNRIYLGEIVHKGKAYEGEHPAIITNELFDAVQTKLAANRVKRTKRKEKATASPLTGKLFDSDNLPMRPTFGHGRGKKIYRYYVSETLLPIGQSANGHNRSGIRLSAPRLERVIGATLLSLLPAHPPGTDAEAVFKAIARVRVKDTKLRVRLELAALLGADEIDEDVLDRAQQIDPTALIDGHHLIVTINGTAARRGSTQSAPDHIIDDSERRRLLVDLIRKSHRQLQKLNASPLHPDDHIHMTAPINEWGRQRVAIGLLAPDIQKMLLQGKAPPHITPDLLLNSGIPMDWEEQRRMFGMG